MWQFTRHPDESQGVAVPQAVGPAPQAVPPAAARVAPVKVKTEEGPCAVPPRERRQAVRGEQVVALAAVKTEDVPPAVHQDVAQVVPEPVPEVQADKCKICDCVIDRKICAVCASVDGKLRRGTPLTPHVRFEALKGCKSFDEIVSLKRKFDQV